MRALHLAQGGVAGDAGGIDQDVERAVRGDDVFDQPAAGVEIGDVAGGEMDVEAGGFPAERLDEFVDVAQVDCEDGAALRSQCPEQAGKTCCSQKWWSAPVEYGGCV